MIYIGALISIQFVALTVYWLLKKYNPQAVLLISGLLMLGIAMLLDINFISTEETTRSGFFNLFKMIGDSFSSTIVRSGLMILAIGGYVAYLKEIKASDALVYVSMQPLMLLKKYPYLAACSIIPIGQLLFIFIPSATGLGLLLVASILPILLNLGVSKLTAVSVITACTLFDTGPGSANVARAAELAEMNNLVYFVEYQLPLVVPMTIFVTVIYYFTSRYFDRKDRRKGVTTVKEEKNAKPGRPGVPLVYALLPVLPIILLLVFSRYFQLFNLPVVIDTTTAVFLSFFISMLFELVRTGSFRSLFRRVRAFWDGMAKMFGSVITLIVCAEIFSQGLISLGLIEALVEGAYRLGFAGMAVGLFITVMIFLLSLLMGSGNAAFFSFGPIIPGIARRMGAHTIDMLLPMQLASGLGRAGSPISGVVIALSEIAGVSSFQLAKRNLIPLCSTLLFMILYHLIF